MNRQREALREKRRQEIREWMLVSVTCFTAFSVGLSLTKMIVQSRPMRVADEIKNLKGTNRTLLKKVPEIRLTEGGWDQATAAKVRALEADIKEARQRRDQYVKEERLKEERQALRTDMVARQKELDQIRRDILQQTATGAENAPGVRQAKRFFENEQRIAELDAIPGILYTDLGPVLLILVSLGFQLLLWLGIGGIVFLFGIGGVLLVINME